MISDDIKAPKSTDAGLSLTDRKLLRASEAREAMAELDETQRIFDANRERLRGERLAREAVVGSPLAPAPSLPDDTLVERLVFPTRIRRALLDSGLKTVGEIRQASDATLLSLENLGKGSVTQLREKLGCPAQPKLALPKSAK